MDPKQTAPQGGQEGQNGQAQSTGANPVFGAAGNLGGNTLSTGANVSQTMDSLNSGNSFASGKSLLQRKRVDNVDPVTGDIIISSSPNDKPAGGSKPINKALLIKIGGVILVLGAIALVVGIIFAFVSGGDKKSNNGGSAGGGSSSNQSSLTVDQAFNEYANWVISGTPSQNSINEVSIRDQLAIKAQLGQKNEETKEYFSEAKKLFDNFYSKYENSDLKDKSAVLRTMMPDYKSIFNFIYDYSQAGGLDSGSLAAIVDGSGASAIDSYFEENYGAFADSDLEDAQEIYNYQKEIAKYQKEYFTQAVKKKCLADGVLSEKCNVSMSASDTQAYEAATKKLNSKLLLMVNKLISGINQINLEIKNPTSETGSDVTVESDGIGPDDIRVNSDEGAQ